MITLRPREVTKLVEKSKVLGFLIPGLGLFLLTSFSRDEKETPLTWGLSQKITNSHSTRHLLYNSEAFKCLLRFFKNTTLVKSNAYTRETKPTGSQS